MDVMVQFDPIPDEGPREVAALAMRYCALIDNCEGDCEPWLPQIAALLSRLQALMATLPVVAGGLDTPCPPDLDARFELFSRLHRLLADRDGYWLEFDLASDGVEAMTGSLADDLTDIYCELRLGLRIFERDPQRALSIWCLGYVRHWARHLVDAERHLTALAVNGRL
ncbi:MAG: DUF5063 domain-containing protein [Chromatiaceae bacterium]|nr:DUF5063 domain-containing protein [Chromatiaceae bacterium]